MRMRRIGAGLVVACALVVTGLLIGRSTSPTAQAARRAPERTGPVTARPVRQRLADVRNGTCALAVATRTVPLPEGADGGVVTALFVRTGQPISAGGRVLDLSGRPVLALSLPFPLYRTIAPMDRGADVAAVQGALEGLGLYRGHPSGIYDVASQAAVRALFEHAGVEAPATEPDAERRRVAAERAVDEIDARLRRGDQVPQADIDDAVEERS
ncbi:MAG: peptidoglycan-binding domain-containing protein, partial [Aquihabitans sp.]